MSFATYSELQTSISGWLHRGDLTSIIPDFIALAEQRINGDLDARLQDSKTTLTTTSSVAYVDLPTDLINIRHLSVVTDPVKTLKYTTPDTFEVQYPYDNSGVPLIYSVIGSKAYLAPTPDSAYTLDIVYKARVPALSSTTTTNWLLTTYPHVYLYAALCEAAPYLKDDNRIPVWESKYREAIDTVNSQDWYSGSTMVVRTDVR